MPSTYANNLTKMGKIMINNYLNKAIRYYRNNGIKGLVVKCKTELFATANYQKWIQKVEASETYDAFFVYKPKISVLVPVYNVLSEQLEVCIESVCNQIYDNWELVLVDDCSTWDSVRTILDKYKSNPKIKVIYREENGHISRCTNTALENATGEFVGLLDCDDVLRKNALYEVVKVLNSDSNLDFIYSDEDKIDEKGRKRHTPHFKPDWSPDTLMSHMYTCHFGVYRKTIAEQIGGFRVGYEGCQDYDFTLRFTEFTDRIAHIPKILYHWRERKESTSASPEAKPYILEAAKKCKEDAIKRRGLNATTEYIKEIYQYRIKYIPINEPLVSIVIPSKDNYEVLYNCLKTLFNITQYKNYEIIIVDNGSEGSNRILYERMAEENKVEYIYIPMEFNFSKMCNIGAGKSHGDVLVFLNDDIEIIDECWLANMVGHAQVPHTGAVGAKLLYPDRNRIQHIGIINIDNGPIHPFAGRTDRSTYYFNRNRIEYNYLAVTAACMAIERKKFEQVGGFDETLAVAYNDVDLCFKLVENGYYNVVRNDAVLIHHESISRGDDRKTEEKFQRLMREQKKLYEKHPKYNIADPFYNINLSSRKDDFSYNKER